MSGPDAAIVAAYERGFERAAKNLVTIERTTGVAPNTSTASATVHAIIRNYAPDSAAEERDGFAPSKQGTITQGDRSVIVLGTHLQKKGFPLPVAKNDRVLVFDVLTGAQVDKLNVVDVDAFKRAPAAAIEIRASGVS